VPELAGSAWILLAVGAVLVGISKTALPGAGTLAVALFATALPARTSVGALLVLLIVGDLFALRIYRTHADLSTLKRLVPPVLAGVVIGTVFLALADDSGVRRTIGVLLLALLAVTLLQRRRQARRESPAHEARSRSPQRDTPTHGDSTHGDSTEPQARGPRRAATLTYGTLGGFTTMVANAAGPVMSLYFLAASTSVNRFLGTAAWFFFTVNLAKTPFAAGLGLIDPSTLMLDLVLIPGVVIGAVVGRGIARRLRFSVFDRIVLVLTAVSAVYLVLG